MLIAHSVLLEVEWVLRAVYELSRPAILKAMRQVLGLPNTHFEQAMSIAQTLQRYERGFDFADALHLAQTAAAGRTVTFDKGFARAAAGPRGWPWNCCSRPLWHSLLDGRPHRAVPWAEEGGLSASIMPLTAMPSTG